MEPVIRRASEPDTQEIERIVSAAYKHYVSRIGKSPAPMTDDYRELVCHGNVWVLTLGAEIAGLVVLKRESDYMLLDNVAVKPDHQGSGFGRQLIEFAEARARQCGYDEIQLYTNALMHENLAMYAKLGYQEFSRRRDSGFDRVFFRKSICR
jgi:ribosomal protein S18 acetylase RimI-like enzyme